MLRAVRRRVDDLAHEGADELPGRLVALHQVRCAAYPGREDERGLQVVLAGRADDQVVDRVLWCLLEFHADDVPAVAEFNGPVADEEMSKVLDRDLALEGDAAAARGVRARSRPQLRVPSARPAFPPARSGPGHCRY